jgi:hypothetical protein
MTTMRLSSAARHDSAESIPLTQKEGLERAVAKVVALGARAGVSADQMIQLLQSGFTVGELLDYLEARLRNSGLRS